MPTSLAGICPSGPELAVTTVSLAMLVMFVAGMVGHGVLRSFLEARGVAPWSLLDSLGSMGLVMLGTGVIGGSGGLLALWGISGCDVAGWSVVCASGLLVCGVVMTRLGLHALRKLT